MDKAGITVAAAHRQMLSTASGASSMMGGLSMIGDDGRASSFGSRTAVDREAAVAQRCQLIAARGFEPLENVMGMKEW